jgi:hypothetical protein
VSRDQDHGKLTLLVAQLLKYIQPGHAGHLEIEQDKVVLTCFQTVKSLLAGGGFGDIIIVGEYFFKKLSDRGVIIRYQNT